jgi:hypothetical protein
MTLKESYPKIALALKSSKSLDLYLRYVLLLDNQSTFDLCCNRGFMSRIKKVSHALNMTSNSSGLKITEQGKFPGCKFWVWFSNKAITIVLAYHPCCSSGHWLIGHNGLMKGRGMVAAQHKRYFRKKGNFNKPQEIFSSQLITQLWAWHAVGKEVILFIDVNKNIYTGPLAKALQGDGLRMEEQTLCLTRKKAPHSHCIGKVAIVGTYATPGIICTNSYHFPHDAGV